MAKDEYGLTTNQRAFADEYIANKGNATQAYLKAYPKVKNESTARVNGSKLLTNTNVSKYIADITEELLSKSKMTSDQVIIQLTSIARREIQTSYTKQYDHLAKRVTKEITYTYQPTVEESTKALELLTKWLGLDNPNFDVVRRKLEAEAVIKEHEASKLEFDKEKQQNIMDLINIGRQVIGGESE